MLSKVHARPKATQFSIIASLVSRSCLVIHQLSLHFIFQPREVIKVLNHIVHLFVHAKCLIVIFLLFLFNIIERVTAAVVKLSWLWVVWKGGFTLVISGKSWSLVPSHCEIEISRSVVTHPNINIEVTVFLDALYREHATSVRRIHHTIALCWNGWEIKSTILDSVHQWNIFRQPFSKVSTNKCDNVCLLLFCFVWVNHGFCCLFQIHVDTKLFSAKINQSFFCNLLHLYKVLKVDSHFFKAFIYSWSERLERCINIIEHRSNRSMALPKINIHIRATIYRPFNSLNIDSPRLVWWLRFKILITVLSAGLPECCIDSFGLLFRQFTDVDSLLFPSGTLLWVLIW